MYNAKVAGARLRLVRFFPTLLEGAFRSGLHEAVFIRDGRPLRNALHERASFHLDRAMVRTSERSASAHTALERHVEQFANAGLGRRLSAMPLARLHLAPHGALDMLVSDRASNRYALRFVCSMSRLDRLQVAALARECAPDAHELVLFDIDDGAMERVTLRDGCDRATA